jgi:hypothetical protein
MKNLDTVLAKFKEDGLIEESAVSSIRQDFTNLVEESANSKVEIATDVIVEEAIQQFAAEQKEATQERDNLLIEEAEKFTASVIEEQVQSEVSAKVELLEEQAQKFQKELSNEVTTALGSYIDNDIMPELQTDVIEEAIKHAEIDAEEKWMNRSGSLVAKLQEEAKVKDEAIEFLTQAVTKLNSSVKAAKKTVVEEKIKQTLEAERMVTARKARLTEEGSSLEAEKDIELLGTKSAWRDRKKKSIVTYSIVGKNFGEKADKNGNTKADASYIYVSDNANNGETNRSIEDIISELKTYVADGKTITTSNKDSLVGNVAADQNKERSWPDGVVPTQDQLKEFAGLVKQLETSVDVEAGTSPYSKVIENLTVVNPDEFSERYPVLAKAIIENDGQPISAEDDQMNEAARKMVRIIVLGKTGYEDPSDLGEPDGEAFKPQKGGVRAGAGTVKSKAGLERKKKQWNASIGGDVDGAVEKKLAKEKAEEAEALKNLSSDDLDAEADKLLAAAGMSKDKPSLDDTEYEIADLSEDDEDEYGMERDFDNYGDDMYEESKNPIISKIAKMLEDVEIIEDTVEESVAPIVSERKTRKRPEVAPVRRQRQRQTRQAVPVATRTRKSRIIKEAKIIKKETTSIANFVEEAVSALPVDQANAVKSNLAGKKASWIRANMGNVVKKIVQESLRTKATKNLVEEGKQNRTPRSRAIRESNLSAPRMPEVEEVNDYTIASSFL